MKWRISYGGPFGGLHHKVTPLYNSYEEAVAAAMLEKMKGHKIKNIERRSKAMKHKKDAYHWKKEKRFVSS